jgi:hypothetical protein
MAMFSNSFANPNDGCWITWGDNVWQCWVAVFAKESDVCWIILLLFCVVIFSGSLLK